MLRGSGLRGKFVKVQSMEKDDEKKHAATVVAVLCAAVADVQTAEGKNWSDQSEFSYVETVGNSETSTLSL